MVLCCPYCGVWSVDISGVQPWRNQDGTRIELVAGRCGACRSLILSEPSPNAVETTRDRMAAGRDAMARIAGD